MSRRAELPESDSGLQITLEEDVPYVLLVTRRSPRRWIS
jgi:hypothetical protein